MAGDRSSSALDGDPRSLACQINVAIASSHTRINRLILDRMPRAVPPRTSNPSTYITGLIHIGAVYIAFESLWQGILGVPSDIAPVPYVFLFSTDPCQHDETPQITERTRQILEEAYWPNMVRADRIKADIRAMTGWPAHVVDEQIRSAGTSGRLGKFTLHIRDSVIAKPHLLLAYAYSLYLALLSGGSYIRTELLCLKPQFWHETPTPIRPHMVGCRPQHTSSAWREHPGTFEDDSSSVKGPPLDFLDFDPPLGENPRQQCKELKAEFKARFALAEQLLAEPERQDIVEESAALFHHLEGVVGQLDAIFGTPRAQSFGAQKGPHLPTYSSRASNIGARLRDSIAIAKGRLLGAQRKLSGSSSLDTEADPISKQAQPEPKLPSGKSSLAHDAVVPSKGFRTIRYDTDFPHPDRSPGRGDHEKSNPHGFDGAAFDCASADVERCPMSRTHSMAKGPTLRPLPPSYQESPDYALYAVISKVVVLMGVAMVMAAYLYVR